jgi:hypothetical protein
MTKNRKKKKLKNMVAMKGLIEIIKKNINRI